MTATGGRPQQSSPSASRASRVLVVDDDPGLARCLDLVLRSAGLEPDPVSTAAAALESVRRERPDLVLLDLDLTEGPERDTGDALIALLRESGPDAPTVPVLVVAARARPPDVARAVGLGADAFVAKPFETGHLLDTVAALIGGRR